MAASVAERAPMAGAEQELAWCQQFVHDLVDDVVEKGHERHRLLQLLNTPGALASEPLREVFPIAKEHGIRTEIAEQERKDEVSEGGKVRDNYGQLKVIRQILLATHLRDPEEASRSLSLIQSCTYFWCNFMHWYRMLEEKVQAESYHDGLQIRFKYPWTMRDIASGVLERPYMLYLLSADPFVTELSKESRFESLPEMSRNSLRMNGLPMYTLQTLHHTIQRLRSANDSGGGCSQAIAVGQTNHWIAMIILRHASGVVETIVLDSRNNFTLGKTQEELQAMASHRMRRFKEVGVWADMRRRLYVQSLEDTQFSAALLHDAATGRIDIAKTIVTFNIESFFESYTRATGDRFLHDDERPKVSAEERLRNNLLPEEPNEDGWLASLIHWLENITPPPVMESSFCNNLLRLKDLGFEIPIPLVIGLRKWVSVIETRLKTVHSPAAVLTRFRSTLGRFREVLEVVDCAPRQPKY